VAALELSTRPRPGAAGGVVVLGASNVSRGLARLVGTIEAAVPDGVDIMVAAGHGRSYGATSRVWMRRLPPILRCGLWRALDRHGFSAPPDGAGPLCGLVTDIGNDILYGIPVQQVAAWVWESLRRLAVRRARIAVTRLPLDSVARVGPGRYRALKTLFVPGCPLSLAEIKESTARLDREVAAIAAEFDAVVIDQPGEWYGLDTLHVRRRHLDVLWRRAVAAWGLAPAATGRTSLARWAALGTRAAEVRSLAGVPRFVPQPAAALPRGGTLSLY